MKTTIQSDRLDLSGPWSFAFSGKAPEKEFLAASGLKEAGLKSYPCLVPGNFELDLQEQGLAPDPFFGLNPVSFRKYEDYHLWYFRRFPGEEREGCDTFLVFEGLDCLADIYLNGTLLASTDNALVEHSFEVTGLLKPENELFIHIKPITGEAKKRQYPPALYETLFNYESLYTRKAPHVFGWDIMPKLPTAGIWRPVSLSFRPRERLEHLFLETSGFYSDNVLLRLHYQARTEGKTTDLYYIKIELSCGDSRASHTHRSLFQAGAFLFPLYSPRLWWPKGSGEPNLYDVTVTLLKEDKELDSRSFTHGIRKVELLRTSLADKEGNGEFCFKINNEKVFIRGTNWVPLDAFHSRDRQRILPALALAADLNCNLIRCWGGNVYEDDLFFDTCDREGIMVWQDFAMACGVYPQDPAFCQRLEEEARKVVRRLRQHPSLVLWAGDNECDAAYTWDGKDRGDPNRNKLTREVLPGVLWEEDFTRPYLPSSPYIDSEAYRIGKDLVPEVQELTPENHLWGPRGYYKGDFYARSICHFASEIGYHGCPSPESVKKFISPEKLWPYKENKEWILHGTSPTPGMVVCDYRVELMASQVRMLFGEIPDNLEGFSSASQAVQAEAFKFFIELFRSAKWRRTGIVWWNLLDGWPQFSDAVVDYYFDKKLAYHFIKRSQRQVCLILREPEGDFQELIAVNDSREDIKISNYRLADVDSKEILTEGDAVARANSATSLARIPFQPGRQRFLLIDWQDAFGPGRNHYLAGQPPFDLAVYQKRLSGNGLTARS